MNKKILSVWVESSNALIIQFWDRDSGEPTISYRRPISYLYKLGPILYRLRQTNNYICRPFFAGTIGVVLETKPSEE